MSDEHPRADRHPTDEPDGTPAFEASLRPPGETVNTPPAHDPADDPADDTAAATSASGSRAGYDPAEVSGDTDAVRPG